MAEGFPSSIGAGCQRLTRDAGVETDHRDLVGDHIVQIAGDAEAILGDAPRCLGIPCRLRALSAPHDLGDVPPSASYGVPERCAEPDRHDDLECRGKDETPAR